MRAVYSSTSTGSYDSGACAIAVRMTDRCRINDMNLSIILVHLVVTECAGSSQHTFLSQERDGAVAANILQTYSVNRASV